MLTFVDSWPAMGRRSSSKLVSWPGQQTLAPHSEVEQVAGVQQEQVAGSSQEQVAGNSQELAFCLLCAVHYDE